MAITAPPAATLSCVLLLMSSLPAQAGCVVTCSSYHRSSTDWRAKVTRRTGVCVWGGEDGEREQVHSSNAAKCGGLAGLLERT